MADTNDWVRDTKSKQETCLHKLCPECHGTGRKEDGGICVHFISCPCPKCSISCEIQIL